MDPINRGLDHELADIKRRLSLLESSGGQVYRAGISSTDPEELAVELGVLSTQSDTSNKDSLDDTSPESIGLGVYSYDDTERLTRLRVSDVKGLERPFSYSDWRKTTSYESVNVTSASYVDVWHVDLAQMESDTISFGLWVTTPAGTNCTLQVDLYAAAHSTSERAVTGAGLEWHEVRWQHGMSPEDWTGWQRVRVRCKRTSGAGTVIVREPLQLAQGDVAGADSDGWYN